jgi:hypothetical protein
MRIYKTPRLLDFDLGSQFSHLQGTGADTGGSGETLGETRCTDSFCLFSNCAASNDDYTGRFVLLNTDCSSGLPFDSSACTLKVGEDSFSNCTAAVENLNPDCELQGCAIIIQCDNTGIFCSLGDDKPVILSCPGYETCEQPLQTNG